MSFAMEDISPVHGSQGLQTHVWTQKVSDKPDETEAVSEKNKEMETFELSESSKNKVDSLKDEVVSLQEDENILEVASYALASVRTSLKEISSSAKDVENNMISQEERKAAEAKINDNLSKIEEVSEKTTFNGEKILDGSMSDRGIEAVSLESLDLPKQIAVSDEEEVQKVKENAQKASDEIQKRQMEMVESSKQIIQTVSSNVEIGNEPEEEPIIENEAQAQDLSNQIQGDIFKSPEKSVKIQIKSIDKNMILAMLSLNTA